MDILVSYDIANTETTGASRLRRIADICAKYGQRVQLSVFECRVSRTRLARLLGEIQDIIDDELDSVLIYRFAGEIDDATVRLGRNADHQLGKPWLL